MINRLASTKCHKVTAEARTGLPDAPVADGSKNRTVGVASEFSEIHLRRSCRLAKRLASRAVSARPVSASVSVAICLCACGQVMRRIVIGL